MAALLADGGFPEETSTPLSEAASLGLRSLAIAVDPGLEPGAAETMSDAELTELAAVRAELVPGSIGRLASFDGAVGPESDVAASRAAVQELLAAVKGQLGER